MKNVKQEDLPAFIDSVIFMGILSFSCLMPENIKDKTYAMIVERLTAQKFDKETVKRVTTDISKSVSIVGEELKKFIEEEMKEK